MSTPQEIVDWASKFVSNTDLTDVEQQIAQQAADYFAAEAAWRWLASASTVATAADTATATLTGDAANMGYPAQALILEGDQVIDLEIVSQAPTAAVSGPPRLVSFSISGADVVAQIWPRPQVVGTLYALFKQPAQAVTLSDAGTLDFPTEYQTIYRELVLYYVFLYADDVRAGTVTTDPRGGSNYSRQIGMAQAQINKIRQREAVAIDPQGQPRA